MPGIGGEYIVNIIYMPGVGGEYIVNAIYIPGVGGELSTIILSDSVSIQISAPLQAISLTLYIPPSWRSKWVSVYSLAIPFSC